MGLVLMIVNFSIFFLDWQCYTIFKQPCLAILYRLGAIVSKEARDVVRHGAY
jgi:hypothetical protein